MQGDEKKEGANGEVEGWRKRNFKMLRKRTIVEKFGSSIAVSKGRRH